MRLLSFLKIIGGLTIALILLSCNEKGNKAVVSPLYFNLNKLIDQQVHLLDSLKPSLSKSLTVDEINERKIITSIDWRNELEIFREVDINSPQLRETFDIKDGYENGKKFTIYTPKKTGEKGVIMFKVNYNSENQPTKIYCKLISDNWFYSFQRIFQLDFTERNNQNLISNFSIRNIEELLFQKKAPSVLQGNLIFP